MKGLTTKMYAVDISLLSFKIAKSPWSNICQQQRPKAEKWQLKKRRNFFGKAKKGEIKSQLKWTLKVLHSMNSPLDHVS